MRAVSMLSAALLCLSAEAAHANLIPYNFVVPLTQASWVNGAQFALFDPSLGTLNSAELSGVGNLSASYQMQNLATAGSPFSIRPLADLGLYFVDDTPIIDALVGGSTTGLVLPGYDGISGSSSASYAAGSGLLGSGSFDTLLSDPTSLSYFTGTGESMLYIVAQDMSSLVGTGLYTGGVTNQVSADVTLTLNYTPNSSSPPPGSIVLPEPSGAVVFGVACLALLGLRRRARR